MRNKAKKHPMKGAFWLHLYVKVQKSEIRTSGMSYDLNGCLACEAGYRHYVDQIQKEIGGRLCGMNYCRLEV